MLRRWLEPLTLSASTDQARPNHCQSGRGRRRCLFAKATLQAYLQTHRLLGGAFLIEQMWVVVAYLIRRPARTVSRSLGDWILAFGGTFAPVLFRPIGAHPRWGVDIGLGLQCSASQSASFPSSPLAARSASLPRIEDWFDVGPYAIVRHPIYASYLLLQSGTLLQTISAWNALVLLIVTCCNVGRILAEDRLLATNEQYDAYRTQVPWRLLPDVW